MIRLAWKCTIAAAITAVAVTCVPCVNAEPVNNGDAAVGLSSFDPDATIELVTQTPVAGLPAPQEADSWNNFGFVQSVEFDNSDGVLHYANGNLLGVNFGTSGGGGSLYQYPAPTTGPGTAMIESGTANDTMAVIGTTTRLVGAGVSFNNRQISLLGYDLGELSVLDYDAAGSSVSLYGTTAGSSLVASETQGTTWLGSDTVAAMSSTGGVYSYDATTTALTETFRLNVAGTVAATGEVVATFDDAVTDIEYNPNIADVIITSAGIFSGGATTNYIFAIDPNTNMLLDIVDLTLSANTLREISWNPDGDLIVSQFAGGGGTVLDILPNYAGTIGTFPDNGSLDYYVTTTSSSFNGVDVAFIPEPAGVALLGLGSSLLLAMRRRRRW